MQGSAAEKMSRTMADARPMHERDFDMSDADFARIRTLIHQRAGIALSPIKRDMVYSRLARRLRALGMVSFRDYLDQLENGPAGRSGEWEEFTNALTTNLTSFFREPHHFPVLADHLRAIGKQRPITIWCCAASTGEEPYTIAMTAVEALGGFDIPVHILGSDIDTRVLETARAGVYNFERVEKLSPERLKRFFLRGSGANADKVKVRDELKKLVQFRPINLLESGWPLRGPFDVIFCRNVMIYFDKPTQLAVLERFAPLLRSDGLLFCGHSESLHHAAHLFRLRGKTVYTRAQATGAANVASATVPVAAAGGAR